MSIRLLFTLYTISTANNKKLTKFNFLRIRKRNLSSKENYYTDLVIWGTNLGSTAKQGRFTKQVRGMIHLPPYQYSVIVGLLLSDGWLSLSESRTLKNARLDFRQSINKSAYVWFVFNCLNHYCSRYPYSYASIRNDKPHYNLTITTRALPCFTELYYLFYNKGKKIIPHNIYDLLTPVALAHLIMGDGTALSSGFGICTDSFSIKDVVKLLNVLIIKYNFNCVLHNDRGRYRIYINKSSMPQLIKIVLPHMIPSMMYKFRL